MNPSLKYAGEALFLTLLAFRLLRWTWGAISEGDAPPSTEAGRSTTIGGALMENAEDLLRTTPGIALPGEAASFPPEMLAAMTPEQRAKVLETLGKQRAARETAA